MKIQITHQEKNYEVNLSKPLDLSISLKDGLATVNCFYAPPVEITPVKAGDFVGDTRQGGAVNFKNVKFNPHGNGTHTECVGHISKEPYFINDCLREFSFIGRLISIFPQKRNNGDRVIERAQLEEVLDGKAPRALVIRTLPNDKIKLKTNYSGVNPPYIAADAVSYLVSLGVEHLLIDLPSVDREEDGGALAAHKAFWQYPDKIRKNCTITELIYVNNEIKDGLYFINMQIASLELDAAPSRPVLYSLNSIQ